MTLARGILSTILHADGAAPRPCTPRRRQRLGRMEHITKDDIDAGRVHFRMDGKAVFENGVARMSEAVLESLKVNHLTLDAVDVLIPHQANLRMLEAIVTRVGAPIEKVFVNVEKHGNMASACLPVALDQARKSGLARAGSLVLLVAFGSGFVWAGPVRCDALTQPLSRRERGWGEGLGDRHHAQLVALDLASRRLGQCLDEFHPARVLVRRGPFPDELLEFLREFRRRLVPVLQDDVSVRLESPSSSVAPVTPLSSTAG